MAFFLVGFSHCAWCLRRVSNTRTSGIGWMGSSSLRGRLTSSLVGARRRCATSLKHRRLMLLPRRRRPPPLPASSGPQCVRRPLARRSRRRSRLRSPGGAEQERPLGPHRLAEALQPAAGLIGVVSLGSAARLSSIPCAARGLVPSPFGSCVRPCPRAMRAQLRWQLCDLRGQAHPCQFEAVLRARLGKGGATEDGDVESAAPMAGATRHSTFERVPGSASRWGGATDQLGAFGRMGDVRGCWVRHPFLRSSEETCLFNVTWAAYECIAHRRARSQTTLHACEVVVLSEVTSRRGAGCWFMTSLTRH